MSRRSTAHKVDSKRLTYFDLRPTEDPVDTLIGFGHSAWPAKLPLGGQPMDRRSDEFFESPYVFLMSPEEMNDMEAAASSFAMFGFAVWPQLAVLLVTTQRLLWRPLAGHLEASGGPGDYVVYEEQSMGQRYISNNCIASLEPVEAGAWLPYGMHPAGGFLATCKESDVCRDCVLGAQFPIFNVGEVEEFSGWTGGAGGLLVQVAGGNPNLDPFLFACDAAGIAVMPREMIRGMRRDRAYRRWRPMHERM